ncbi:MAG: TAT-variant-translocated molybdopterin oxidoreductase, partial [Planctomycetota bacterium]|nr:TAT-variant-translocated molybdopterin oxidoreductase [Planctomycetota bacterium]
MSSMSKTASKNVLYRSLEELEDAPEFQEFLTREFPEGADSAPEGWSRRRWLQLMGASAVLAGVSGCRFENRKITPYSFRSEDRVPGETRTFATTIEWAGNVRPLFVTSYDARPIKADGSPLHPLTSSSKQGRASATGASDEVTQACVLDLYDPDRSRGCLQKVGRYFEERSWEEFGRAVGDLGLAGDGNGVLFLAEPTTSRTVANLKSRLLEKMPKARWFSYAPVNSDNEVAGLKVAFGKSLRPHFQLDEAEVVVCLDADPMADHPDALRNTRGWSQSREPQDALAKHREISRWYAVESQFSLTGVNADHRWPMKSSHILSFAEELNRKIDEVRKAAKPLELSGSPEDKRLAIMANELVFGTSGSGHSGGKCVVIAGARQPAAVHHLVARMNDAIGSKLVAYTEIADTPSCLESMKEVVQRMGSGDISTIVMLGGNPVYDAPDDVGFESALEKVKHRIHFSMAKNETTDRSDWHLNQAHPMEVWSDSVAYDGSICLGQPMIDPLFGARSTPELLSLLMGDPKEGRDLVRSAFAELDEGGWSQLVHDGFVKGSAKGPVAVGEVKKWVDLNPGRWRSEDEQVEVVFTASKLYDGRLANNGWLQEVPDPVTKVTWDNPAVINPKTAKAIGAKQNEKIKIEVGGKTIEAPVFIQPGQAENSIGISIGYGRKKVGYIGGSIENGIEPVGVDVGPIRSTDSWDFLSNAKVSGTGSRHRLASTQDHHAIDLTGKQEIGNRYTQLIFEGTFEHYQDFAKEHSLAEHGHDEHGHDEHDHDEHDHDEHGHDEHGHDEHGHDEHGHAAHWPGYKHLHFDNVDPIPRGWDYSGDVKWGMTIDLNKCTGCNACVVACQAENNIAVVGKDQVARGRELHWLRIDRYLSANETFADAGKILEDPEPKIRTQPVTCHHCENAPCEQVCPVAATVHSDEGLNDMVYNRCIGTRYCGNNCPYKVRRFNYLNYSDATTFIKYPWADKLSQDDLGIRGLVNNPEVTIRSRGVMEKCTFCVQRIQNGK